jgi:hypothetical protein
MAPAPEFLTVAPIAELLPPRTLPVISTTPFEELLIPVEFEPKISPVKYIDPDPEFEMAVESAKKPFVNIDPVTFTLPFDVLAMA